MQHYVPKALVMMAPYVNSYRRLTPDMAAPVNNAWGYDNRTTAFRVPTFRDRRRGGWKTGCRRRTPTLSGAGGVAGLRLSRHGQWAGADEPDGGDRQRGLDLAAARPAGGGVAAGKRARLRRGILGREFTATLAGVKRGEFETFMRVISPWEREFLLLNV
jgi:glutamine synthetase